MTFGNILFGGIIGVAVDASSGAMNKYPPSISLVLPPVSFPTAAVRDTYYDRLIATVRDETSKSIGKLVSQCGSPNSEECKAEANVLETSRDARVAEFEAMRARAKIGS